MFVFKRSFFIALLVIFVFGFVSQPALVVGDDFDIVAVDDEYEDFDDFEEMDEMDELEELDDMGEYDDFEDDEEEDLIRVTPEVATELAGRLHGLYSAKKYNAVVDELLNYDGAERYEELGRYLLWSYIHLGNWNRVNAIANGYERASGHDAMLVAYARGLHQMNIKKPNYSKAMEFLKKAKSGKSKEVARAAGDAYFKCMLKAYWYVGLIGFVALIPVLAGVKKALGKRKTKKVKLDLEAVEVSKESPVTEKGLGLAVEQELSVESAPATTPGPEALDFESELIVSMPEPAPVAPEPAPVAPEPAPVAPEPAPVAPEPAPVAPEPAPVAPEPVPVAPEPAPVVPEPTPVVPEPAPVAPEPAPVASEPAPVVSEPATVMPKAAPVEPKPAHIIPKNEIEEFEHENKNIISRTEEANQLREKVATLVQLRKEPVIDPEIESIWERLSAKALNKGIEPHARPEAPADEFFKTKSSEVDTSDLTLDLSEESMREDYIGKLKMLAISDGELRELLAQKNVNHLPAIIEYIMTKPEPARLAFVARGLGFYRDAAVIDTLSDLLHHKDDRVALAAIQGLENTGNTEVILLLCPFIRSEIPVLAQAARSALTKFGPARIIEIMLELPKEQDEKIREAGVFLLSRMNGTAVEQLLMQMLKDPVESVRCQVILAMSFQKNPVYIDKLREFFKTTTGSDRTLARKAIVYLQGFLNEQP